MIFNSSLTPKGYQRFECWCPFSLLNRKSGHVLEVMIGTRLIVPMSSLSQSVVISISMLPLLFSYPENGCLCSQMQLRTDGVPCSGGLLLWDTSGDCKFPPSYFAGSWNPWATYKAGSSFLSSSPHLLHSSKIFHERDNHGVLTSDLHLAGLIILQTSLNFLPSPVS